jgi:hypothetical protein
MLGLDEGGLGLEVVERARKLQWATGEAAGLYLVARSLAATDPTAAFDKYTEAIEVAAATGARAIVGSAMRARWTLHLTYESIENLAKTSIEILRHFIDAGFTTPLMVTLVDLCEVLDRTQHYEPVAVIAGYTDSRALADEQAAARMGIAIDNARTHLGDRFPSLEERGRTATAKEIVDYIVGQLESLTTE